MNIKIRFNTDKDKVDANLPPWRVLVDGVEHLASNVAIHTKTWTTFDEVEPGKWKWHLTCEGTPHWDASSKECTVR